VRKRSSRRIIGAVIVAVLNVAVAFGNYGLTYIVGVGCGAAGFFETGETAACESGSWGWPGVVVWLPTAVALAGGLVSLVRHRFDAAFIGLGAAPLVAWVVAGTS
jgi:hypothetical protein